MREGSINVGTIGHVDHEGQSLVSAITQFVSKMDGQDALESLAKLKKDLYHLDMEGALKDNKDCQGDFDKKVLGKHTYPHWVNVKKY